MTKPNVMLLGFTVPDEVAKQLFSLDTGPAVQTHKFAWSLTRALQSGFGRVVLASACPLQNEKFCLGVGSLKLRTSKVCY